MPEAQRVFFKNYCMECHDADKQKGKVRLDDISFHISDIPTAERWQKILGVINAGEMPPEDKKQPRPEEKASFLEALSSQMVTARKALSDSGGAITMRRLNRREYVHTIRDLLDVEVRPKDLPADDDGGSFDTIGSGLFFSSDQFQQYLKLARAALDEAMTITDRPEKQSLRIEVEEDSNKRAQNEHEAALETLRKVDEWRKAGNRGPAFDDETEANTAERVAKNREASTSLYLNDPATRTGEFVKLGQRDLTLPGKAGPGRYVLRVRVGYPPDAHHSSNIGMTPLLSPQASRFLEFGTMGEQGWPSEMKLLACPPVKGSIEKPEIIEISFSVSRTGPRIFAIRERRPNGEQDLNFFWDKQITQNHKKPALGFWRGLWIDWIEWEGPFVDNWPPRSLGLALGDIDPKGSPDETQARQAIERFAQRAFRGRPLKPEFMDRLMMHYMDRIAAGESFIEAIKTPLSIVLASPSFLYIAEHAAEKPGKAKLSDIELANRLSYFLWSSPPDDALMQLARDGKLSDPTVLTREVDRLLADEKVMRFISGFTHQWLHMVRLDFFQFSWRLYPTFDGSVKASARREVYETLRTVLANDLPLGSLLKSDFVVVNNLLADYYDIPGVEGEVFRRVPVPAGLPRGGLLGMAAILAMGSDGERSSPVERGVWVLRTLLNDPPPPAPANVPQLSRFAGKLLPARELMLAHQEQPQCSQCHRRIDPIGFALENFDAAGRWRTQELTEFYKFYKVMQKQEFFPIDATGTLPDSTTFNGFHELRDALAKREADFAKGLVEHLIQFGLGRPCGFSDDDLVHAILLNTKDKHYTPRTLIHALVLSKEFRTK
jgi:hypothetical protein